MRNIKIIFFILFIVQIFANAEEVTVVDVKRNIPMADTDTVYKDFAINAGTSSGLKKNMVVFVKRRISVKDASAKTIGEIETNVAQLKLIHVDSKVSMAREYKEISRDDEAMLEQTGVMVGDRIDLAGSFVDNKPMVYKKMVREPSSLMADAKPATPAPAATTESVPPAAAKPSPTPILQIKPIPVPLPEI